jgi:O-antigen ligase
MTTLPLRQSRSSAPRTLSLEPDRVGVWLLLLLVWLFFEFGRPADPLKIPLLISLLSFLTWLPRPNKQWSPQTWWFLVFLGVCALGIPLAANTYSAYQATYDMAILFLCICLPLQSLLTSVRRIRIWVYTLLAIILYVGTWAVFHGGMGPSGTAGSQDENYVAALVDMAIPFAFFSLFVEKRRVIQVLLVLSMVVFVGAIALGGDPSRGGFLGLCAVALYCLMRSPKKILGIGAITVIGVSLVVIAGPVFWQEIRTSTNYETGTGDVRLELWQDGLRMWQANPLLGVGAGNFKWVIENYQSAAQFNKFHRSLGGSIIPHSLPVELFAELGLAGAIPLAILIWRTWSSLGRVPRAAGRRGGQPPPGGEWRELRCYADAVQGGILAILVNGVFLSLLYYSHLWLLIAVGGAIPHVYRRSLQALGPGSEPATAGPEAPSARRRRGAVVPGPRLLRRPPIDPEPTS